MNKLKGLNGKPHSIQQREMELEARVEELTDFIDNASIPLHWVNDEGIIVWANQAELDILGYTKDEYVGHPISDFHAEPEVIADILSRLTNNETLHNYPARLRCKDGSVKDVLINSNVLRKDGEFIHTRCFTRDVTEFRNEARRKAELMLELEQSEARLRMAIDSTRMGTWDFNPITGDLTWSDECKRIYGLQNGAPVTYEMFQQHIFPEDKDFVQREVEKGQLQYVGKVGTGFSDKTQKEMMSLFKPLITDESPFDFIPDVNKPSRFRPNPPKAKATWLKPELVCEVAFAEVTSDGVFRHPSFQGMREDKKAKDVVRETAEAVEEVLEEEVSTEQTQHDKAVKPPKGKTRKTLLNPKD